VFLNETELIEDMVNMNYHSGHLRTKHGHVPLHYLIASNGKNKEQRDDLVRMDNRDIDADPNYWLIRGKGEVAVFGLTGLVKEVYKKEGEEWRPILFRPNAYGNFREFSGRGVEEIIDDVYRTVGTLKFRHETGDAAQYEVAELERKKELFNWWTQRVIARFGDFRKVYNPEDIVPDFNDHMAIIKIMERCKRGCLYCPERRGLKLYTEEQIEENADTALRVATEYHGDNVSRFTELFYNGSDWFWNYLEPNGVDPLKIIEIGRERFPNALKTYAFAGTPTVNKVQLLDKGYHRRMAKEIYSFLIGHESFDDITSRFLGKGETAQEKKDAFNTLKDAGVSKIKTIIQVGMIGEGFYYKDDKGDRKFRSRWDHLEETARHIIDMMGMKSDRHWFNHRKDKVLISRYQPIDGTPLKRLHDEGSIVKPYSEPGMIEEEIEWLREQLRQNGVLVETEYEYAINEGKPADKHIPMETEFRPELVARLKAA